MVDVRFELTTNGPWSVDDAICEGISPLGYWQEVNQSPAQTKPYNTNIYIHTTNRQQNTQTQYPRHGEKPGINMTQATTTAVLRTQHMYRILHHQRT